MHRDVDVREFELIVIEGARPMVDGAETAATAAMIAIADFIVDVDTM